jgi:UDP-3-O-[3-hydroxymyristoyl] glucosamine N-acyltransferase
MADPDFFTKARTFTLEELAEISGSRLVNAPSDQKIADVASLDQAGADQVSFFENIKYKNSFLATKAGACFVSEKMVSHAPDGLALLVSAAPYKAYARAAQAFYPDEKPKADISPSAHIDKSAEIGEGCTIEPGAVIKAGVKLGKDCWVEAGAVIGTNVVFGDYCRIGSNATISHARIGNHVRLYPGVRIGQDGFGFAIDPSGHIKVPQLGRVIIHDHCEIGANTTIDRGAGPDTVIGAGTWIDNLVQIGHNVKIGRGCIIVSQVGISGSTELGDFVAMGGQSGVAGHLKIGSGARIAAQSGLMRDVPAGEEYMGSPAVPIRQFMRQVAKLGQLVKSKTSNN